MIPNLAEWAEQCMAYWAQFTGPITEAMIDGQPLMPTGEDE